MILRVAFQNDMKIQVKPLWQLKDSGRYVKKFTKH